MLPNNKAMAERRLAYLARKLEKNPTLKQAYDDSMQSLIHKGYAEKVPEDSPVQKGVKWYRPHHPVINPDQIQDPCSLDGAAKYKAVALNNKVLQGPNLTNGLLNILL